MRLLDRMEKMKAAYRLAYSLFDKVAFFLNAYLDLKLDESRVYFRGVWYLNADRKKAYARGLIVPKTGRCAGSIGLPKTFLTKTSTM